MMLKFGTICYFSNLLDKIVSKTVGHAHNWLQQKLIVRKRKNAGAMHTNRSGNRKPRSPDTVSGTWFSNRTKRISE